MAIVIAEPSLSDAATVTTDSELATLPVTNLQRLQPSEVWRSGASAAYIQIDLLQSHSWNLVALIGTNATATSKWRVRASDTSGDLSGDSATYDSQWNYQWPVSNLSGVTYNKALLWLSTPQKLRYIRIDVDNGSGYCEAGRLYVAHAWQPSTDLLRADGWSLGGVDESPIPRAFGGEAYPNQIALRRRLNVTLNFLNADEMFRNYQEMVRIQQASADVLVSRDYTRLSPLVMRNAFFELWASGATSAPDGYVLGGTGATIAKDTSAKFDRYCVALTYGSASAFIYQAIHSLRGIAYWQSKNFTFGVWAKTSTTNRALISINDGVGSTNSSYHSGGGEWEWLSVTRAIDAGANSIYCYLLNANTGTVYFDGAKGVLGTSITATTAEEDLVHWHTVYGMLSGLQPLSTAQYNYYRVPLSVEELI